MKKSSVVSLFILMTGLLFLIGGASYAFFSYQGTGNNRTTITASGITFKYTENNVLTLTEAMPMTVSEALKQNDYFEFEISGETPIGVEVPYHITARKTSNSSDIDDAIMVGLTKKITYNSDIYAFGDNSSIIDINNLQNLKQQLPEDVDFFFNKIHSTGETVNNNLYALYYIINTEYNDIESCQLGANDLKAYTDTLGTNRDYECIEQNSKYYIKEIGEELYNSLEECEIAKYGDKECTIKYNVGDNYTNDIYTVTHYVSDDNIYKTLEECNNKAPQNTSCIKIHSKGEESDEILINTMKYSELMQYSNDSIDLSNYIEKDLYSNKINENTEYKQKYRVRMWIDENTDFTQSKYNGATFGLKVNVYAKGKTVKDLTPGLYDEDDKLLYSWAQLESLGFTKENIEAYWYIDDDEYKSIIREEDNPTSYIETLTPKPKILRIASTKYESEKKRYNLLNYNPILGEGNYLEGTTLVLPDTIEYIGQYALSHLNIRSIKIPSSIVAIEKAAFARCYYLSDITVEENSQLKHVAKSAFIYTTWYNEQYAISPQVYLNGILLSDEKTK